jgi:hypothetical protein
LISPILIDYCHHISITISFFGIFTLTFVSHFFLFAFDFADLFSLLSAAIRFRRLFTPAQMRCRCASLFCFLPLSPPAPAPCHCHYAIAIADIFDIFIFAITFITPLFFFFAFLFIFHDFIFRRRAEP